MNNLQTIPKNLLILTTFENKKFNNLLTNNEIISEYKFNYNLYNFNKSPTPKSPLK